jgi:hypothetical protein
MEQKQLIIGAVVLVIFIIIYLLISSCYSVYNEIISGMWSADPEWAELADLDGMLLYIGPNLGNILKETRKGYLIMYANDKVIASKQIEFNMGSPLTLIPKTVILRNITVVDLDDDNDMLDVDTIALSDIMPSDLTMELSVGGKLILTGDPLDELDLDEPIQYAKLFKDPSATDISKTLNAE